MTPLNKILGAITIFNGQDYKRAKLFRVLNVRACQVVQKLELKLTRERLNSQVSTCRLYRCVYVGLSEGLLNAHLSDSVT